MSAAPMPEAKVQGPVSSEKPVLVASPKADQTKTIAVVISAENVSLLALYTKFRGESGKIEIAQNTTAAANAALAKLFKNDAFQAYAQANAKGRK